MEKNKIIYLDEYRNRKVEHKKASAYCSANRSKKLEEDERKNTFNLFMRVLSTIREESY